MSCRTPAPTPWRPTSGWASIPDLRSYALPAAILRFFQLQAVRLYSNNPDKVRGRGEMPECG